MPVCQWYRHTLLIFREPLLPTTKTEPKVGYPQMFAQLSDQLFVMYIPPPWEPSIETFPVDPVCGSDPSIGRSNTSSFPWRRISTPEVPEDGNGSVDVNQSPGGICTIPLLYCEPVVEAAAIAAEKNGALSGNVKAFDTAVVALAFSTSVQPVVQGVPPP